MTIGGNFLQWRLSFISPSIQVHLKRHLIVCNISTIIPGRIVRNLSVENVSSSKSKKANKSKESFSSKSLKKNKDKLDLERGISSHIGALASMISSPTLARKEKKKRSNSQPKRDPTASFTPTPSFPHLPSRPRTESDLNWVRDSANQTQLDGTKERSEDAIIFTDIEHSNNFVEQIRRVFGNCNDGDNNVNDEEEDNILREIRSPQQSNNPFTVVAQLKIPPEFRQDAFHDLEAVIGMGRAVRARTALNLAKWDLAERILMVVRNAAEYLPIDMKRRLGVVSSEIQVAQVGLSVALRERLTKTCRQLDATGIFSNFTMDNPTSHNNGPAADDYQGNTGGNSVRSFFKSLSPQVINSMKAPPGKLPVNKLFHRIVHAIEHHNVTILSAATGSGKTTQLPQMILDYYALHQSHFDRPPSVLVTQPRRIAAKTVAQRIAQERDETASERGGGRAVGYAVRFESRWPTHTADGSILFCTAGILLRRLQREPNLPTVTHLVLDEVHERDVFTDIALLVTRDLLQRRPDLRLILMSATMEAQKFVEYFRARGLRVGTVLDIEGTNHPVSEFYLEDIVRLLAQHGIRPTELLPETSAYVKAELETVTPDNGGSLIIEDSQLQELPLDLLAQIVKVITTNKPPGAILVFLPGWEEITELHNQLQMLLSRHSCEYHLLHSTAPVGAADAAFKLPSPGTRKIILATNIAESSVTIPDVVYVVDSGRQKVMHYDQRLRMNVLEPCWVSQANLRQRRGRAGRCQPGEYYGLLSRQRIQPKTGLPEQTLPELKRLGLDEVVLNLKAMGLTAPAARILSGALDAPERSAVVAAVDRLATIGAIDEDERLTPLGRLLSTLPIHPGTTHAT